MSGAFRFPRSRRLRSRRDFLRIQRQGLEWVSRHFVWLVAPQEHPGAPRLGITASRRIGGAVERNRAKRLVREVFRQMPDLLPDGVDLVVIVRRPLTGMKFQDVFQQWQSVRSKLRRRATEAMRSSSSAPDLR